MLRAVAAGVGDNQVRHRGTLGGSAAHGDPASDLPAVLLAVDASFVVQGPGGERTIPAADFFLGFLGPHARARRTALRDPRAEDRRQRVQLPEVQPAGPGLGDRRRGGARERRHERHAGEHGEHARCPRDRCRTGARAGSLGDRRRPRAAEGTEPTQDLNASPKYHEHLTHTACSYAVRWKPFDRSRSPRGGARRTIRWHATQAAGRARWPAAACARPRRGAGERCGTSCAVVVIRRSRHASFRWCRGASATRHPRPASRRASRLHCALDSFATRSAPSSVGLADQPLVGAAAPSGRVASALTISRHAGSRVATYHGARGNPVLHRLPSARGRKRLDLGGDEGRPGGSLRPVRRRRGRRATDTGRSHRTSTRPPTLHAIRTLLEG